MELVGYLEKVLRKGKNKRRNMGSLTVRTNEELPFPSVNIQITILLYKCYENKK